jgi:hypothetical protein
MGKILFRIYFWVSLLFLFPFYVILGLLVHSLNIKGYIKLFSTDYIDSMYDKIGE